MKKFISGFCLLALLQGCTTVIPVSSDWIDVPLSDNTWWEAAVPYQEAEFSIPLAAGEGLEHMLNMQEGGVVVYSWTAAMADGSLLTAEFHGHTVRETEAPGTVMFYKMRQNDAESGSLKAPFTGVHGWYFKNESEQDIEVKLAVAGFFQE